MEWYLLYYSHIKVSIGHGVQVTKVNIVNSLKQKQWLETYIPFNAKEEAPTKIRIEPEIYKLLKKGRHFMV